jgi:hypothetical protein
MDIHRVKRDRLRGQLQVLREWLASCQSGATAFMCSCGRRSDLPAREESNALNDSTTFFLPRIRQAFSSRETLECR